MASPLSQFEINKIIPFEIFGYDISFTNSSLAMLVTVLLILLFFIGLKNASIIPSKSQSLVELSYEFIADMIGDNIGKDGMKYLSFIFFFIYVYLLGKLARNVTLQFYLDESHNSYFCHLFFIFILVTFIAISKHGLLKFLGFFAPSGLSPKAMLILLVPIEIISYFRDQ